MFKACIDCVGGCVSGAQQQERYGTELNGGGGFMAPPWQKPDQKMYRMPTELKSGTEMTIGGVLPSDGRLNLELRNDSTVIFQMLVSNENIIEFTPTIGTTFNANELFGGSNYILTIISYNASLNISVGESDLGTVHLRDPDTAKDIKYLMINGQVMELKFKF